MNLGTSSALKFQVVESMEKGRTIWKDMLWFIGFDLERQPEQAGHKAQGEAQDSKEQVLKD